MKDQDKILINAYLDGEVTADETKVVEQLLKSDEEAQAYMQGLQEINLELTAFSNNEELRDLKQWTSKYVEENVREQAAGSAKVKSFFEGILFRHFIGYSLTAAFFVSVGVNLPSQDNSAFTLEGFDAETTLRKEFPKFRNQAEDTEKDKIRETISEMLEQKVKNAAISWGGDSYFISLDAVIIAKEDISCIQGSYLKEGKDKQFTYCYSENDETITYIN
jgi:hypothetical protein